VTFKARHYWFGLDFGWLDFGWLDFGWLDFGSGPEWKDGFASLLGILQTPSLKAST